MTGADLCRVLVADGVEVGLGTVNAYHPGDSLITLRPHCYGGTSAQNLTLAAHEAGHAQQHRAIGWLAPALRWLLLGRLFLEWDASRRAREMLAGQGLLIHEGALLESWRGYLFPALWQTGTMLVLIWGAIVLRR